MTLAGLQIWPTATRRKHNAPHGLEQPQSLGTARRSHPGGRRPAAGEAARFRSTQAAT
jgi:hypothetical protein